jgi:hypothetical protein
MKVLKQRLQETFIDPDKSPRTFPMTLRDFIDSLEFFDNQDRIVEVFLDSPIENALCVKFPPVEEPEQWTDPVSLDNDTETRMIRNETGDSPEAPTEDQREPRITHLSWIMAELKGDLGNWSDNYSVGIMMNSSEPGKIWMVFQKEEDGYQDWFAGKASMSIKSEGGA